MNKIMQLMQLYADNQESEKILNVSVSDGVATIYAHGIVYPDVGLNAAGMRDAIAKAGDAKTIIFNINTPGGSVFEGREIMDVIRNVEAKTIAHIGSLCASAGTSIALACDEVEMANGAHFMIHNAHGGAQGDKTALRKVADFMEKVEGSIITDYTNKTGKPAEEIAAMMEAETWMTAKEALDNGFIDRIAKGKEATKNTWNLSAYTNAPKPIENTVAAPVVDPVAIQVSATQSNRNKLALIEIL